MIPRLFEERMQGLLGDDYPDFLATYQRGRCRGLRMNSLKAPFLPTPDFLEAPVPWAKDGYYYKEDSRPGLHPFHEAGVYYMQEPSAMAPVTYLDPKPHEKVLDLCASPGGKSTQIAALMENQGLLLSNEIHPERAKVLSRNMERMCVRNAIVTNESPETLAPRFPSYFDKILVDAPCSEEGMFLREEVAITDWSPETNHLCAQRQLSILNTACAMLKAGGRLVYSTCTFAPEENEGVVDAFLSAHPEFEMEPIENTYFEPGHPEWVNSQREELKYAMRLFPHKIRGEGHFLAVMRKTEGETFKIPEEKTTKPPKALTAFWQDTFDTKGPEQVILFGDHIWLPPEYLPRLEKLKVLRCGLELGTVEKDRFVPSHALALTSPTAKNTADYAPDSEEIKQYLHGNTIPSNQKGWTLVQVDGCTLGWGKGDGTQLKNHYPKGLRK